MSDSDNILVLCICAFLFIALIAGASSYTAPTQNRTEENDYLIPSDATLFCNTDFTDITLSSTYRVGVPEWYPEIQTWVGYANVEQAIVQHPVNPAKKALRIVFDGKIDANSPIRPMFMIFLGDSPHQPDIYNELWVEAKYFFPKDFSVTSSNPWFIWCEPFIEYEEHPDLPYPIHNLDANFMVYPDGAGEYYLQMSLVKRRLIDGVYSSIPIILERWNKTRKLPLEEEFTVRWHVKRHFTSGTFELWFKDEKIIDFTGQTTEKGELGRIDRGWRTIPLDHYCDPGNPVSTNYLTYLDIWVRSAEPTESPEPPIPPPPIYYFYVNLLSSTGGYTVPNAGNYTNIVGETFSATASAYEDYTFEHWLLDGTQYTTNRTVNITGTVTTSCTLQPVFAPVPGEPPDEPPEPPPPIEPPPEEEPPEEPPEEDQPIIPPPVTLVGDSRMLSRMISNLEKSTVVPDFSEILRQLETMKVPDFDEVIRRLEKVGLS